MKLSAPSSPRLTLLLSLTLIAGLNALAYLPSRHAPYVFDDWPNIVENADVQSAGIGRSSLLALASPWLHPRRPLAELSFALNLRAFGPDPFSFHVANLAIHILTAWLLFALIREMIKRSQDRQLDARTSCLPALAGALLWSLHPVQTAAVTYLVQRMTSLAALFYLLAFLFWIVARSSRPLLPRLGWFLAAGVSALLGFLVKETLVTLPLTIVLWELVWREKDWPWRKRLLALAVAGSVMAAYALGLLLTLPRMNQDVSGNVTNFYTFWGEQLLNQPRIIWHYLSLLAFPLLSRLNFDPEWTFSSNLLVPWTTLPAWIALAALLLAALAMRGSRPAPLFVILFFLFALLPESVIPIDPVFEHRLYLPSTALLAAAGAGWAWPGRRQPARLSLLALGLLWLFLFTLARNHTFSDDLRLWQDTVKKSPNKARVWTNLATAYQSRNFSAATLHASLQAVRLQPSSSQFSLNLSRIYLALGKIPLARSAAEQARALKPDDPSPLRLLGQVEKAAGNPEPALAWYLQAREISPEDPETLEQLGNLYLDLKKPEEARSVFFDLLSRYPGLVGFYFQIGNSYISQGRWSEAAEAFSQELRLNPNSSDAANNLGLAWLQLDRPDLALPALERAVERDPEAAIIQVNLGEAQARLGRLDLAEGACRRAVALEPSLGLGWQQLGEILLRTGRREDAIRALETARQLLPEDPEVRQQLEQARSRPSR